MIRKIFSPKQMTLDQVCKEFGINNIGQFSDGYHTFDDLYYQRTILTAALVKAHLDKCWKSWKDEYGNDWFPENNDGVKWFLVQFDTPQGGFSYHYPEEYWDMFDCKELPKAKHFDGHTSKDVTRLLTI